MTFLAKRRYFELWDPSCDSCGRKRTLDLDIGFDPLVEDMLEAAGFHDWDLDGEVMADLIATRWTRVANELNSDAQKYSQMIDDSYRWDKYGMTLYNLLTMIENCRRVGTGIVKLGEN